MARAFPPELSAALREISAGRSQRDLGARSGNISAQYRRQVPSSAHVGVEADAIAYALSRMPATYAAMAHVLDELADMAPDFAPHSILDAGAGPGTASWAAREVWPDTPALTLFDHNTRFLDLAADLAKRAGTPQPEIRLGDLTNLDQLEDHYDLVLLGYAVTELTDAQLERTALGLWQRTAIALVIVEPGRPRDYQRLMSIRSALVGQGASIVAPCAQSGTCPLQAPDWCHFSVRLQRSRDHQALKGASLGYEDEKFSYLVAARPDAGITPTHRRIIKPPAETKFAVDLELCAPEGIVPQRIEKRSGPAFKRARKLNWGGRLDTDTF